MVGAPPSEVAIIVIVAGLPEQPLEPDQRGPSGKAL
jgi:hypothetical protein